MQGDPPHLSLACVAMIECLKPGHFLMHRSLFLSDQEDREFKMEHPPLAGSSLHHVWKRVSHERSSIQEYHMGLVFKDVTWQEGVQVANASCMH